jgi:hypothetical protein
MLPVCVGLACWTYIAVLVDFLQMALQRQNMYTLIVTMNCILLSAFGWLIYWLCLFVYSNIMFKHSLIIPYGRSKKVSITCMFSYGWITSVCSLNANVSVHPVGCIFTPTRLWRWNRYSVLKHWHTTDGGESPRWKQATFRTWQMSVTCQIPDWIMLIHI